MSRGFSFDLGNNYFLIVMFMKRRESLYLFNYALKYEISIKNYKQIDYFEGRGGQKPGKYIWQKRS